LAKSAKIPLEHFTLQQIIFKSLWRKLKNIHQSRVEMMRMYAEREAKPKEQIKKKESHKGEGASNQWKNSKKSSKRPEKGKPLTKREFNFTPLNTSVVEVFMQIRNDPGLKHDLRK
jgi:hypothetical protein